jgi:hypothetical protein
MAMDENDENDLLRMKANGLTFVKYEKSEKMNANDLVVFEGHTFAKYE